jgi:signal recognition particle GTPase
MNSSITAALALAGLALGGYAVLRPAAPQVDATPAPVASDPATALSERVDELEARLADLEAAPRRKRLRRRGVGHEPRRQPHAHPDDPVHDEPEEGAPAAEPELRDQVRQMVEEQRKQHREKRHEKRLTKFKTRVADKLAEKVEEGLFDEDVAEQLATFLVNERENMHAVFTKMRSGDLDHREAREELGDLREKTKAAVAEQFGEGAVNLLGDLSPLPMHRRRPPADKKKDQQ